MGMVVPSGISLIVGPLVSGADNTSQSTLDSGAINYTIGTSPLLVMVISGAGAATTAFPLSSVAWQSGTTSGTWTKVTGSSIAMTGAFAGFVGAEVWTCVPTANIVNGVVRATKSSVADSVAFKMGVLGYNNATTGATASAENGAGTSATLAASITPQSTGGVIVGAWVTGNTAGGLTPNASTTEDGQAVNTTAGGTACVGRSSGTTTASTPVSIGASDSQAYRAIGLLEIKAAA
jgi:hypothetical protein